MLSAVLLSSLLLASGTDSSARPAIRYIEIIGNLRLPRESILDHIAAAPGKEFDEKSVRADLGTLYCLGVFETVRVDSREAGPGLIDLIYRVRERLFVSSFFLDGVSERQRQLIDESLRKQKLEIRPGTPFRPDRAKKAANVMRRIMAAHKYPMADVEQKSVAHNSSVGIVFQVRPGPRLEIGEVRFQGNESLPAKELVGRMGNARPASLLTGWSGSGRYLAEELPACLERVLRLYRSRGYALASVGRPEATARAFSCRHVFAPWSSHESLKIGLRIPLTEGPIFTAKSVRIEGDAKRASSEICALIRALHFPGRYDCSLLESTRGKLLAALGRHGFPQARVDLDQVFSDTAAEVDIIYRIAAGDPMVVRRIDFAGNMHLPGKFLRRQLRLQESQAYDSSKLDKSIERLNRSGLIKEMRREDVNLTIDEKKKLVDIIFNVKEKDRRGIFGTGGTGGVAGGYLGIICTAFDVLGLGEKLSFELDGGASQFKGFLGLAADHFLGAPYSLGFSLAHRLTGLNAANLVPGPRQIVNVFRSRSTGGTLSGSYHVGAKVALGIGFQMERESTQYAASEAASSGWLPTQRSMLRPALVFDSTGGAASVTRGIQFDLAPSWSAPSPLRSADTFRQSVRLKAHRPDPWSKGRNQFAFQFTGVITRPLGDQMLPLERRLFPTDEMLRGFARGAITPWSYDPGAGNAFMRIQPAGCDAALGFSSEYRVPIYRALSGAAFMDLGWTGLSPGSLAGSGSTIRIIENTNRLVRVSTGGELRLTLPGLGQPARLIFAWNPLRLDTLLGGAPGSRLADLRGSIRFALGNIF